MGEYLKDMNGTRAAIAAGYSPNGAEVTASKLLRNSKVSEQIDKKLGKKLDKLEISSDRILNELAKVAFLDPRKFYDEHGNLKPVTELDDESAAGLASLEVYEEYAGRGEDREAIGQTKKVKYADKIRALELLGKYRKLFTDKVEHSGKLTLEDLVCGRVPK